MYAVKFAEPSLVGRSRVVHVPVDDEETLFRAILNVICEAFVQDDWGKYSISWVAEIAAAVDKKDWKSAIEAWERAADIEITYEKVAAPPLDLSGLEAKLPDRAWVREELAKAGMHPDYPDQ